MSQPIGFNKSGTGQQLVINQLVIRPPRRASFDVGEWRAALRAWDYGRRTQMLDLYDDVLIDNVLSESIDKRVRAITNATLVFQTDGVTVPEVEAIIDTQAFEDLLTELLWSKFRGKTVTELSFVNGFEAFPIPAKNLRPLNGTIAIDQSSNGIINYRNEDFFIEAGKDNDLGLLYRLAPLVIYKRGGFGDWSQYVELFGMPQRIGKYSAYDETSRKLLIEALENAGSAPYAVIPKETDVETIERKGSTGQNSLYNEFRQACNEEMLIGVLGQTMTTLNGSSKSQSETHMDVEEDLHASDQRYVARILNSQLVPRLEKRGFPVKGGKFTFPEKGENISLKDRIEIDTKVNDKVPFPKKYWYKTYGVDEPKDGEDVTGGGQKEQAPPPTSPQKAGETAPTNEKPADKIKLSDEQSLLERVLSFFFTAPAQKVTGATDWTGKALTSVNLADSATAFDFNGLLSRIASSNNAGTSLTFDVSLFTWLSNNYIKAFRSGWNSKVNLADLTFEYGTASELAQTAMEMNLFHFSSAKTLAEITELNRIFRESKSFTEFFNSSQTVADTFNRAWAQTEYDTAYLTAESSATYYRLKDQTDLFPYWQYMTVNDGHVRPEHAALHGLILPANDKRWAKIWPPNGWNCRCYVIPLTAKEVEGYDFTAARKQVDDYFKTPEWKTNEAQGWGVNRADKKLVFTENQFYIRKFPDMAARNLGDISYYDWKLGSIAQNRAKATASMPTWDKTASDWWNANQTDGSVKLTDWNGRIVVLGERSFNSHTGKGYTERVRYLDAMKETLANPDEVWINNFGKNDFNQFVAVKYYNDKAVVVVSTLLEEKGEFVSRIVSWFPFDESFPATQPKAKRKALVTNLRRGLLIKKPGS